MSLVEEPTHNCGRVIANFRQGSLLRVDDLDQHDRSQFTSEEFVFVISHDCDITAESSKEPHIEVLSVEILDHGDQNDSLIYGKNPREIHLPVKKDQELKYLKLSQLDKKSINKQCNIDILAIPEITIESKNFQLLQSWLSSRYKRHSFPETLASRLAKLQNKIESRGKNVGRSNGIIALFINVDPWTEELSPEEPYELDIIVLYESEIANAEKNALLLQKDITTFLTQVESQFPNSLIGDVKIRNDSEFTLKDMRAYVEWRFEHLSFRGETAGTLLP